MKSSIVLIFLDEILNIKGKLKVTLKIFISGNFRRKWQMKERIQNDFYSHKKIYYSFFLLLFITGTFGIGSLITMNIMSKDSYKDKADKLTLGKILSTVKSLCCLHYTCEMA